MASVTEKPSAETNGGAATTAICNDVSTATPVESPGRSSCPRRIGILNCDTFTMEIPREPQAR